MMCNEMQPAQSHAHPMPDPQLMLVYPSLCQESACLLPIHGSTQMELDAGCLTALNLLFLKHLGVAVAYKQ